jgi:hypothetical protein
VARCCILRATLIIARNSYFMLDLDCFNRRGIADSNIRDSYVGIPGVGTREPSRGQSRTAGRRTSKRKK